MTMTKMTAKGCEIPKDAALSNPTSPPTGGGCEALDSREESPRFQGRISKIPGKNLQDSREESQVQTNLKFGCREYKDLQSEKPIVASGENPIVASGDAYTPRGRITNAPER